MIEIISFIVISVILIGMFVYHIIIVKEYNKQIRELSKLIRAKDLTEYSIAENIKKDDNISNEEVLPDLIPAENLGEDIFNRMIKKQRGEEEE